MSQQQNQVGSLLRNLLDNIQEEVDLSTITGNLEHKGVRVDFFLPDKRAVIEVHGIQHFKVQSFGKNKVQAIVDFNHQLHRDDRLVRLCKENDLIYIQINHDDHPTDIFREIMKHV